MSDLAIQTQGLVKLYSRTRAVDGLSLSVPTGAIYGFLGRNGAGKTTTIKTLLGLTRPTAGQGTVLGHDIRTETVAILQRTGFVSENKMLFDSLTGAELVRFDRGFFPTWSESRAERYIRRFEIPMDTRFCKLSLGNRTKLCLLLALAQGADLLILDEPTAGLDPVMVDRLMQTLVEDFAGEGKTVFFSSHHLSEVERVSEWVGIIERGRLRLEARLDDVRGSFRMITASGEPAPALPESVVFSTQVNSFRRYIVSRDADLFTQQLKQGGMTILEIAPLNLGEIFLGLVGEEEPCTSGKPGEAVVHA